MPDLVVLWIVAVAVTSVFDGVTLLVWVGVAAAVREDLHLANRDLELVSKVPNRHSVDDEESLGEDHQRAGLGGPDSEPAERARGLLPEVR